MQPSILVAYSLSDGQVNANTFLSIADALDFAGPYLDDDKYRPLWNAPASWLYIRGYLPRVADADAFYRQQVESFSNRYSLAKTRLDSGRRASASAILRGQLESTWSLLQERHYIEMSETLGGWRGSKGLTDFMDRWDSALANIHANATALALYAASQLHWADSLELETIHQLVHQIEVRHAADIEALGTPLIINIG